MNRRNTRRAALTLIATCLAGVHLVGSQAEADSADISGRIAFSERVNYYDHEVLTMNADGTDVRQASLETNRNNYDPSWTGDGKRLVFTSDFAVVSNGPDGSDRQRVLRTGDDFYMDVAVSPDGTKLAYTELGEGNLVVSALDGSGRIVIGSELGKDFHPAWSPDGKQIAYDRWESESKTSSVWVATADGSSRRRLTPPSVDASLPAFSPDGSSIALAVEGSTSTRIAIASVDGADLRYVGPTDGRNLDPTFSPDQSKIAFVRVPLSGPSGVWVMDVSGEDAHLLRENGQSPTWQPVPGTAAVTTTTTSSTTTQPSNKPPLAEITFAWTGQRAVTVAGTSSVDPDGSIVSYLWFWGDGTTPTKARTASHTYVKPGDYQVRLTATDDDGASTTSRMWVRVA